MVEVGPSSGPETPAPARLWTVEEANGRLDLLRELLPQLRAWVGRLGTVHEELQRLGRFWGSEAGATDNPDRELRLRLERESKLLGDRLESELHRLHTDGIEVKDLEAGLIDFYSLREGEVVYLCWQRGESEVGHWHTLTGGFRNRRRIADDTGRQPVVRTLRRG